MLAEQEKVNLREVGELWMAQALAEHASVAAFARFVLHLMQLGAPPDLLHSAIEAMDDEVNHAQLCFKLAERFRGHPASPGAYDISGTFSPEGESKASIIKAAVLEGCINETISVELAREALSAATDEEVRAVLNSIMHDEAKHAKLAWQFLKWAIKQYPELRQIALEYMIEQIGRSIEENGRELSTPLKGVGFLPPVSHAGIYIRAIRKIVVPKARGVFGECVPEFNV